MTRLYGRRRIIEFARQALKRSGVPDRPLPIMLLVGPRGSGGTLLLDRLWAEFAGKCLSTRLDLASAQSIEDVVLAAVQGWDRKIPLIRRIKFPRISMIYKALSFDDDGGGRVAFEAYLRAGHRDAEVNEVLNAALNAGAARTALLLPPEQQVAVTLATHLLSRMFTAVGRRGEAKALNWLVDNGPVHGGNGYDRLWKLYRLHRRRDSAPDAERMVGKTLCAALLADLRSDFNDFSALHGQRPANCLLLLDNAEGRVGVLFLELLAECRRESNGADVRPDPAVVVAVQHGRVPPIAPIESTDEQLEFTTRHPAAADDDDHPVLWYPVRLTDLRGEDVVDLCRSSVLGSESRDADFLHALTGGHPTSADHLARLLERFGRTPFDPRRLLEQPLPNADELLPHWTPDHAHPPTVEDYLVIRALADDLVLGADGGIGPDGNPMVDAMAVLAVTPGLRPGACTAALNFLGWAGVGAGSAQNRLMAGKWLDGTPDGDAVLHPLMDLLLRRWLARKPEAWRDAHQGYAAHYARPQDAAIRHHHTLALVEFSRREPLVTVIGYLEREFDERASPKDWLPLLDQVVAAPNRLRTDADPRAFVTALAGAGEARNRHRAIARLTVARWLYHDRYFDPCHQLAQLIADAYDQLAECTEDNEVLFQQSGKYRRIESSWKDSNCYVSADS